MKKYITKERIWYRPHQMYVEPGKSISLDHLTATEIGRLISKGIVSLEKKVVKVPPKKRAGTSRKRKRAAVPVKPQVRKVKKTTVASGVPALI